MVFIINNTNGLRLVAKCDTCGKFISSCKLYEDDDEMSRLVPPDLIVHESGHINFVCHRCQDKE